MPFIDLSEPYIIDIGRGVAAVFKPCGWHSALHEPGDISVPSWLLEHGDLLPASELKTAVHAAAPRIRGDAVRNREKPDPFQDELGMLYRLDRDTSGILLFALDRSTMDSMRRAQNSMALQKRYMLACTESGRELPGAAPGSRQAERAVLLDRLRAGKEMEVASYFRSYGPLGARVACILPEFAKRSKKKLTRDLYVTEYLGARGAGIEARASTGLPPDAILVEAGIRRGFRHQIRAHSAWMGLPIAGDSLYGGVESKRLFLEAFSVTLYDGARATAEWKLYNGN
jgi:23S rRNA pseudouridine1911/1915/1917 synthase